MFAIKHSCLPLFRFKSFTKACLLNCGVNVSTYWNFTPLLCFNIVSFFMFIYLVYGLCVNVFNIILSRAAYIIVNGLNVYPVPVVKCRFGKLGLRKVAPSL